MSLVRHAFGRSEDIKAIRAYFKKKQGHDLTQPEENELRKSPKDVYTINNKNYKLFGNETQPNAYLANTYADPTGKHLFTAKFEISTLLANKLKQNKQEEVLEILQQVEKELAQPLHWTAAENYYQAAKVAYTLALSGDKSAEIVKEVAKIAALPPGPRKKNENTNIETAFDYVRDETFPFLSINQQIKDIEKNIFRDDQIKTSVMARANYYKYANNEALRAQLLSGYPCTFIEARTSDEYFGIGNGSGRNIQDEVLQAVIMQLQLKLGNEIESGISTIKPQQPPKQPKVNDNYTSTENIKTITTALSKEGWQLERVKGRDIYIASLGKSIFTIQPTQFSTNTNDLETFKAMLKAYQAIHGDDPLPAITTYGDEAKKLWGQAIAAVYPNNVKDISIQIEAKKQPALPSARPTPR